MHIGIDIDGVICNLVKNVLLIIQKKYGIFLRKTDIYKHEIHDILGISKRDLSLVFAEVLSDINQPIIHNASYYINKLSKNHKIILVTSRPKQFNRTTRKWLTLNKINYDRLVNIETDKYAKLSKFDFFIDDHLKEAILSATKIDGLKVVLFDQPWNKSYNIKRLFTRVRTWRQIYILIMKKDKNLN